MERSWRLSCMMWESSASDGGEGESVLLIKRRACSIRATWEIWGSLLKAMWPNWKRKSLDWWSALSRKSLKPIKNFRMSGHTNPTTAGLKPWPRTTAYNTIVVVVVVVAARSVIFFNKWVLKWWFRKARSQKGFEVLNWWKKIPRMMRQITTYIYIYMRLLKLLHDPHFAFPLHRAQLYL